MSTPLYHKQVSQTSAMTQANLSIQFKSQSLEQVTPILNMTGKKSLNLRKVSDLTVDLNNSRNRRQSVNIPMQLLFKGRPRDDSETQQLSQSKVLREPKRRQSSVISTNIIQRKRKSSKNQLATNNKQVNQYVFEKQLGAGAFASVHLAKDIDS